eukprot:PITA_27347
MIEDDLMFSTFGEVYEINCARHSREVDRPIIYFKENLDQAILDHLPLESVADIRLHIYNEITSKFVEENVFYQYMCRTLPSRSHLWTFRKQFSVQLALSGFMSYVLQIGRQTPNKILFAKNTGKVSHIDFHPAYDANGMTELNEPVPFRLTRNLQTLLTPFGVEGIFVSSMCAAAQSFVAQKSQHVQHHLAMFFRDELLSWSWRKQSAMPSQTASAGAINPVDFEKKLATNVEQVIGRIKGIAPQCFLEKDKNTTEPLQSVQRGVTELVEAALQPKSLCMMDPTWHPWF